MFEVFTDFLEKKKTIVDIYLWMISIKELSLRGGAYLERFAANFCVEPRRKYAESFYSDPFGGDFVP